MISALANSAWLASCLPEYWSYLRATSHVSEEQTVVLKTILSRNVETEFGRSHGFHSIRSVKDFQKAVPLRDYDGHQQWIDRIANGKKNVLTGEDVRLFEPTGGSSGGSKLIPYTRSLQHQFRRGIQAWIADLFLHQPELLSGSAYWSVSPAATKTQRTRGGIPVGFEDDSEYLGGWQRRLVSSIMAVPGAVSRAQDIETFRYLTLLFLVKRSDLKLISVWNPSFLSLLLKNLPLYGEKITHDLERGTISRGADCLTNNSFSGRDPQRARILKAAMRASSPAERHELLWPALRLISCWTDANAASPAAELQKLFPFSRIQGKGLLATEGIVSFPLLGQEGCTLALRSHFFEFLPVSASSLTESPLLAHELEEGRLYEVVITTGGGLYRYRTGDLVEVVGKYRESPLLRFCGRQAHVSDWFGEKLNEAHVSSALQRALAEENISPAFSMLACDTRLPAYVLYVESEHPDTVLLRVAATMEEVLSRNFHYDYARRLGQLGPLQIFRTRNAAASYMSYAVANGQRAGDVKPVSLDRRNIWSTVFDGCFVSSSDTGSDARRNSCIPNGTLRAMA